MSFINMDRRSKTNPLHSKHEATTASAAIAAVSARKIRGPSDAARQPFASKSASSSVAHPPSGPIAISSKGISVPAAAIVYAEDAYVERAFSEQTAKAVPGVPPRSRGWAPSLS